MTVRKTQSQKVLNFLATGKHLTPGVAKRLGISFNSVGKRVYDLRSEGLVIYTNKRTLRGGPNRGQRVTGYRLAQFQIDQGLV